MKKIWKKIDEIPNIEEKTKSIQEKYNLGKIVSRVIANKNIDDNDIETAKKRFTDISIAIK